MNNHEVGSEEAKRKALEARAAFKGLVAIWGPDLMNDAIKSAEENQNRHLRGITLPSDDHSTMITIDEEGVSFSVEGWGPYLVPMDTAKVAVMEVREEQARGNRP